MKTFTLEWNAVTTLEDADRSGHGALKKLVGLHRRVIDLGIVTTAASENTRLKKFPETAADFENRLAAVGLHEATKVLTPGAIGLTYFGLCCFARDDYDESTGKIWNIIKPKSVPRNHKDFAEQNRISEDTSIRSPEYQKWRNKWCDVNSIYAHICARRDVFVTGDLKNFKGSARDKLLELGVGEICSYDEALASAQSTTIR